MNQIISSLLIIALASCNTTKPPFQHEVAEPLKAEGIDYLGILAKAKKGDPVSIRKFISFSARPLDGAAGEAYGDELAELAIKIGDDKFNAGVTAQPIKLRPKIAEIFEWGVSEANGFGQKKLKNRFPMTCNTLAL